MLQSRRVAVVGARSAVLCVEMAAALGAPGPVRAQAGPPEPPPILAGRAAPAGTYGDLDVLHYDVVVGLPGPGGTVVDGTATLTVRPARPGLREAVLDFTGLAVLGVSVDGRRVEARHEAGRLAVPLPAGTGPSDTFAVRIEYRGRPDDGLILAPDARGRPAAFVDNWPNRARFWLPSVDHPSDKATASVTVLAPEAWRVISNGVPLTEGGRAAPAADGTHRRLWSWRTDVVLSTYNLVFGADRMEVVPLGTAACGHAPVSPRPDGCVELSAWLYPEDTAQARVSFRRAAEIVDFYAGLVGAYPFEKLAHVQSSTRFGGMENASAIFYSDDALAGGRDIEETVAHETAHQWFGDSVTEADWPELWLSEGFATYFGHLFFEHVEGKAGLRRCLEEDRERVLASEDVLRPVIDPDEQDLFALLNVNNYSKAGWVLHMLRGIVGDEAFFRGVRSYYAARAAGTATTEDVRRAMEEASGRDLEWFFRQWLEEPGYPILGASAVRDRATGGVLLTVRQLQSGDWPTFQLPMEVEVTGGSGEPVRQAIEITERSQTFSVAGVGPGELRVGLDPGGWVLFQQER